MWREAPRGSGPDIGRCIAVGPQAASRNTNRLMGNDRVDCLMAYGRHTPPQEDAIAAAR